jgi:hypothetical protein
MTRKVNWVLDADIRGFYDSLDHEWLVKCIERRIGDRRIIRLIQKWLKAGVLEEGKWTRSEVGTVQGGSISPLLANIYLYYVFDQWVHQWRKRQAKGDVIVVRYADDFIVGFQYPVSSGGREVPGGPSRTTREVQAVTPSGQNTHCGIWPVCERRPEPSRTREAGDIQLPGIYPYLWSHQEREIHRPS